MEGLLEDVDGLLEDVEGLLENVEGFTSGNDTDRAYRQRRVPSSSGETNQSWWWNTPELSALFCSSSFSISRDLFAKKASHIKALDLSHRMKF